jgi:hypothetical protein
MGEVDDVAQDVGFFLQRRLDVDGGMVMMSGWS